MFFKTKVSDRVDLRKKYKGKYFSVEETDNLFVNIRKVLNICSKC